MCLLLLLVLLQILDVLDCTGSGDVDTSKIVKADENGFIEGLYGNKLQVNHSWNNPSGELWCRRQAVSTHQHPPFLTVPQACRRKPCVIGNHLLQSSLTSPSSVAVPSWSSPDVGEWHVGAKRALELFPGGLQARSKAERKKRWARFQRESVTAAASKAASAAQDAQVCL